MNCDAMIESEQPEVIEAEAVSQWKQFYGLNKIDQLNHTLPGRI